MAYAAFNESLIAFAFLELTTEPDLPTRLRRLVVPVFAVMIAPYWMTSLGTRNKIKPTEVKMATIFAALA